MKQRKTHSLSKEVESVNKIEDIKENQMEMVELKNNNQKDTQWMDSTVS